MTPDDKVYVNGIDATTGRYLLDPLDYPLIWDILEAERQTVPEKRTKSDARWLRSLSSKQDHLGLPPGVKAEDVRDAGWGIVFSENEDQAVKDAFKPLVRHRLAQIGSEKKTKVFDYRSNETCQRWLARHGVTRGAVMPTRVPYYLLIVGGPEKIPYSFCNQLDVEYAVGLLQLDGVSEYEQYVKGVLAYESAATVSNTKDGVFFATCHPGDRATMLSSNQLVRPLIDGDKTADDDRGVGDRWGFRIKKLLGPDATKAALSQVFNRTNGRPSFLFTATHGIGFPREHDQQRKLQGALLCQDWLGSGAVKVGDYFAAEDLTVESEASGLVMFSFACFGAGTPSHDRFMHRAGKQPPLIANAPFISELPKKLLSLPGGSALAFIGHIERAWGCSIVAPNGYAPFQNAIGRIFLGEPIGHAMKDFNERYAALSTSLTDMLEQVSYGVKIPDADVAASWLGRNDAEGYVLLGDPAIKLRVSELY